VRQLCHVPGVAPSAYYAWHRQQHQRVPEPAWQNHLLAQTGRRLALPGRVARLLLHKIVGWDVRETMPEGLVSEALSRALVVRRPPAGLIVHSD
jgi:transposase InsO family protein